MQKYLENRSKSRENGDSIKTNFSALNSTLISSSSCTSSAISAYIGDSYLTSIAEPFYSTSSPISTSGSSDITLKGNSFSTNSHRKSYFPTSTVTKKIPTSAFTINSLMGTAKKKKIKFMKSSRHRGRSEYSDVEPNFRSPELDLRQYAKAQKRHDPLESDISLGVLMS